MNKDKEVTLVLSYGFFLLLGFISGMLLFSPSNGIITSINSIDWSSPTVANIGVWTSGIVAAFAAFATAHAAYSSKKAADAATESINKWQLQSAYGKYIDVGVKARVKIRWFEAHLKNISAEEFNVFYIDQDNNLLDERDNDIDALLYCISNEELEPQYAKRYNKYKQIINEQTKRLAKIKSETYNLIEETFELSKNHVEISQKEKDELHSCIEHVIINTDIIALLYDQIFESPEISDQTKRTHIDCYLNCSTSSRHLYISIASCLNLISGYIDNLIINTNRDAWDKTKSAYIADEVAAYRNLTKKGGYNKLFEEHILTKLK